MVMATVATVAGTAAADTVTAGVVVAVTVVVADMDAVAATAAVARAGRRPVAMTGEIRSGHAARHVVGRRRHDVRTVHRRARGAIVRRPFLGGIDPETDRRRRRVARAPALRGRMAVRRPRPVVTAGRMGSAKRQ